MDYQTKILFSKKELNKKILLIGDNLRTTLYLSEFFSNNYNFEVHVLGWMNLDLDLYNPIIKYFNFCKLPKNLNYFNDSIDKLLSKEKYKYVFPINDEAIELIYFYYNSFEKQTKILNLENIQSYKKAKNKYILLKQIEKNKDISNVEYYESKKDFKISHNYNFPFVIRPIYSKFITNNQIKSTKTTFINSHKDYKRFLNNQNVICPFFIQEFIKSKEFGFNFFSINGKIINYYIDENINSIDGTQSSYRELTTLKIKQQNKIKKELEKILLRLNWTGLGMIDFFFEENITIIEFNCRVWSSIKLDHYSQKNLLFQYMNFVVGEENNEFKILKKKKSIRFLSSDLVFAYKLLKNKKYQLFLKWIFGLYKIITRKELVFEFNLNYFLFFYKKLKKILK